MRLFAAFKGFAVHWFHELLLADSAAKNSPHAVMQKGLCSLHRPCPYVYDEKAAVLVCIQNHH